MIVATTETSIDRMAEHKRLERSIVELAEKERIVRESFTGIRDAAQHFEKQKVDLVVEISQLEKNLKDVQIATIEFVQDATKIPTETHQLIREHFSALKTVSEEIDKQILSFKEVVSQKERVMKEILEQRLVLDNHRHDLDIYRNRLESIIKENNLDIKILL
jgi:uncharacterized metal-binding protein